MIENEFKIMLNKAQYEKLLEKFDFKTIVQVNHYYDTDDLQMSERHITVRVRELDGKFFFQMKLPTEHKQQADKQYIPSTDSPTAVSRVELSKELDRLPEIFAGFVLTSFSGVECPEVRHIGTLKTTRSIREFDGGELDLDRSEYFDKTDYELEIEYTDEQAARKVLSEISEMLGLSANSQACTGKIRRFLEEYKKHKDI